MKITTKTPFDRALTQELRKALLDAADTPWWRDVLNDRTLIVASRGASLNVYWLGQSIFKVRSGDAGLCASTHEKFLLDPKLNRQVAFDGSRFAIDALLERGFIREYREDTLARLKQAAGLYAGAEKTGCHWIAIANPTTIDVELAVSGSVAREEDEEIVDNPRIDLVLLEPIGATEAKLVFWEAKTFNNPSLGSPRSRLTPPVLGQIETYRVILAAVQEQLVRSYTKVCADLHAIGASAGRQVHAAIRDVAEGKRRLTLGSSPEVNLLIFGFDKAQRDHEDWQRHRAGLSDELARFGGRLRAVGNPKGARL